MGIKEFTGNKVLKVSVIYNGRLEVYMASYQTPTQATRTVIGKSMIQVFDIILGEVGR